MSLRPWLFAAIGLIGFTFSAVAQETSPANVVSNPRALWTDPAIRDFVGMAENGWDFNRPDTIPGFSSLPARQGSSAAQK
jgi:hypothetical protein